jgi:hypothetical protein
VNLAARNIAGRTMAAAISSGVCELGAMRYDAITMRHHPAIATNAHSSGPG